MMEVYTACFFGHRYIDKILNVEKLLEDEIRKIICEHEFVEFLVGRNGDFDQCASSSVLRVCKNNHNNNCWLVLVLPYLTAEYSDNKEAFYDYYDNVEISHSASKVHPKAAIQVRNREMVDRSQLVICYIEHKEGGAWQTVEYAIEKGKTVLNLAGL